MQIRGTKATAHSVSKDAVRISRPAVIPPTADEMLTSKSENPCTAGLLVGLTSSVSNVAPEIMVQDQPRPNKNWPNARIVVASAEVNPLRIQAKAEIITPTVIMGTRPK